MYIKEQENSKNKNISHHANNSISHNPPAHIQTNPTPSSFEIAFDSNFGFGPTTPAPIGSGNLNAGAGTGCTPGTGPTPFLPPGTGVGPAPGIEPTPFLPPSTNQQPSFGYIPPEISPNITPPVIYTSHWTREDASKIRASEENTFPPFDLKEIHPLLSNYNVWDNWFALDESGRLATVLGFKILLALTYPIRNSGQMRERIAYFFTDDDHHYHFGGFLFHQPIYPGAREWSGSTIFRADGRLQTFYTLAKGVLKDNVFQSSQRFATATQMVTRVDNRLICLPPMIHTIIAEPDGKFYETPLQSSMQENSYPDTHRLSIGSDQVDNFCFRDPKFYRDFKTNRVYLLFEANTGPNYCPAGQMRREYIGTDDFEPNLKPTDDEIKANGCIGIFQFTDSEYTSGHFLNPWLTANLVTDEIERINIIPYDGAIYLFATSHGNKCTLLTDKSDLKNRDYLLGFRAESLFGKLRPLNDSGVILQQKSEGLEYAGQQQNQQYVYSWLLIPTDNAKLFRCVCYAGFSTDAEGIVQPIRTAGPVVYIAIEGLQSRIVKLSYEIKPVPIV